MVAREDIIDGQTQISELMNFVLHVVEMGMEWENSFRSMHDVVRQ